MMIRKGFLYLLLMLVFHAATAQLFETTAYPKNLFRNPLSIPMNLAANFGELRANHYHMGLDIRTQHRINLPVFAAAAGYIYKVRIEPFGFGQAIYILHDNGYVSLYAHLNAFNPALAAYVKQKQYEQQRWDVSLSLPPGLFPVRKGDLIAYSGNMGGSLGPHLHFEIREYPADINLNPMLFGLPIPDNTPPVIRKLALYDRDKSVYEQSPALYTVKGSAGHYSISQPLIYSGASQIGFAISGFDTQSGSSNPNGIYQAQVFDNGKPVSGFRMNRISYNDTRGVNAHIDYRIRAAGGPYYQLLFELPGYAHSIYKQKADGKIGLNDGAVHNIRIELKDANGNTSNLNFKVQYRASSRPAAVKEEGKLFRPMMLDGIETDDCAFYLGEHSLYDSVHLSCRAEPAGLPTAVSRLQHIGNREIPIQDSVLVRIKLLKPVNKKQVLMQWSDREDQEVKAVQWQGDWATASFRNFGNFQLVYDTVPPVISFPGISDNAIISGALRLAVSVHDNFKQVRRFRATLDGNWLLFTNDKAKDFIYTFDEHCAPGKHELKVAAEDEAGNASEAVLHFTR